MVCLPVLSIHAIMFSPTFATHLIYLSSVLLVFCAAGLQLNSRKYPFGERQITILGLLIDSSGVRPDCAKDRAVMEFPVRTCAKDVHGFVGLCSYLRRFVEKFDDIALSDLFRKNIQFSWAFDQATVFFTTYHAAHYSADSRQPRCPRSN